MEEDLTGCCKSLASDIVSREEFLNDALRILIYLSAPYLGCWYLSAYYSRKNEIAIFSYINGA